MVLKPFSRSRYSKLVLGLELYRPDIGDLISFYIEELIHTRRRSKHRCCWVQAELPFPFSPNSLLVVQAKVPEPEQRAGAGGAQGEGQQQVRLPLPDQECDENVTEK